MTAFESLHFPYRPELKIPIGPRQSESGDRMWSLSQHEPQPLGIYEKPLGRNQ